MVAPFLSFHTETLPHVAFSCSSTAVTGWCCCNGIVHHKIVNLLPAPQTRRGGGKSWLSGMEKDYLLEQQSLDMTFSLHPHIHPLTECCTFISSQATSEGFLCNACCSVWMTLSPLPTTESNCFSQRNLGPTSRVQALELQVCRRHFLMQAGSFVPEQEQLFSCMCDWWDDWEWSFLSP